MGGSTQNINVAVVTPGTAVQVSATSRRVGLFSAMAKRVDGENVGTVFIGTSTVDRLTNQQKALMPGDDWEPQLESGGSIDLSDYWIDADNADDGITIIVSGA